MRRLGSLVVVLLLCGGLIVALGGFPEKLIYEIAFANNPLDAAPTWTDVSRYVEEGEWEYGATHELGQVEPGRSALLLNNRDGRFSPWNSSSPYWNGGTGLDPLKPLRIRSMQGGTTRAEWRGFVLKFPTKRPTEKDFLAPIEAVDAFGLFAGKRMPSVWEAMITSMGVDAHYRLAEQSGVVMSDATGNERHGTYSGGATFNSRASLIAGDDDAAIGFDGVDDYALIHPDVFESGAAGWTIGFWVDDAPLAQPSSVPMLFGGVTNNDIQLQIYWSTAGKIRWNVSQSTNISIRESSSVVFNGGRHLVAVDYETSVGQRIYVDGVDVTTAVGAPWLSANFAGGKHAFGAFAPSPTNTYVQATLDEAFIINEILSPAEHAALYEAGATPWTGDTSGERIGRLLDLYGWPAGERTIDNGQSLVQDANIKGKTLLAALQDVERAEHGFLFVAPDGKVTFHDRHKILKPPYTTSQATFSDTKADHDAGAIPYAPGIEVGKDLLDVWNEIPVSRDGGALFLARDATSITKYGERTLTGNTGLTHATDGESEDRANYLLMRFKTALSRVRRLVLRSSTSPSTVLPQQVTRQLHDRVTVKQQGPTSTAAAFSQEAHIEKITKRARGGVLETEWALSAADTQTYLVLDDSNAGKLDTGRLGF